MRIYMLIHSVTIRFKAKEWIKEMLFVVELKYKSKIRYFLALSCHTLIWKLNKNNLNFLCSGN